MKDKGEDYFYFSKKYILRICVDVDIELNKLYRKR